MSHRLQERKPRVNYCSRCSRPMPKSVQGDICPRCSEELAYQQVKEYIRTHDATEMEVAQKFQLPLAQVRHWVQEGFLEYRTNEPGKQDEF